MSKFACLSDPHMAWVQPRSRTDNVEKASLKKFKFILEYCDTKKIPLLIAGDFVDSPRSWYFLPKLINLISRYDVKVYAVRGQHDSYMRVENDTTILGILNSVGLITILDDVGLFIGNWVYLYGFNYRDDFRFNQIPSPGFRVENGIYILVMHASFTIGAQPFHTFDAYDFLMFAKQWDLIVCGDIHKKFISEYDGRYFVNTGPMMRLESTKEMRRHRPCFFVYDTIEKTVEEKQIPYKRDVLIEKDEEFEVIDKVLDNFISIMKKRLPKMGKIGVRELFLDFAKGNGIDREITELVIEMMERYDVSNR